MEISLKVLLCSNKYKDFFKNSIENQLEIINKEFKDSITIEDYEMYFYKKLETFKSDEDFELESRKQLNNYQQNLENYEEKAINSNRYQQMYF